MAVCRGNASLKIFAIELRPRAFGWCPFPRGFMAMTSLIGACRAASRTRLPPGGSLATRLRGFDRISGLLRSLQENRTDPVQARRLADEITSAAGKARALICRDDEIDGVVDTTPGA